MANNDNNDLMLIVKFNFLKLKSFSISLPCTVYLFICCFKWCCLLKKKFKTCNIHSVSICSSIRFPTGFISTASGDELVWKIILIFTALMDCDGKTSRRSKPNWRPVAVSVFYVSATCLTRSHLFDVFDQCCLLVPWVSSEICLYEICVTVYSVKDSNWLLAIHAS